MLMNLIVFTGVCWLTADAYWLLASRRVKVTVTIGQKASSRRIYLALLLLGFVLYYLPLSSVPVLGWKVIPAGIWAAWLGAAMCGGGVLFAIWARRTLGRNWSGAVTLKQDHSLVREGPFSIVRHPIYLGLMVAMIGTTIVIGEVRALLPLLNIAGVWRKMDAEEKLLSQAFPEEYPKYARKVKRLIPWLL